MDEAAGCFEAKTNSTVHHTGGNTIILEQHQEFDSMLVYLQPWNQAFTSCHPQRRAIQTY